MNYHSLPSDSNIPLHCCYKDLAIISFPSTFFLYAIVIMFYLFICYKHYITLLILLYIIYYLLNRFFFNFSQILYLKHKSAYLLGSLSLWTLFICVWEGKGWESYLKDDLMLKVPTQPLRTTTVLTDGSSMRRQKADRSSCHLPKEFFASPQCDRDGVLARVQ